MSSALQLFRAIRQEHEEKKVEKSAEQIFNEIPKGAVMARCYENTQQRNDAWNDIKYLNTEIREKKQEHIDMLDRLQKYEDVEEDFYTYLEKEDMMIKCDSQKIGVFSTKKTKETKTKLYLAHFTIHGGFIRKCIKDDEEPISYTGWFPFKKYKDMFKKLMREKKGTSYKSLISGGL